MNSPVCVCVHEWQWERDCVCPSRNSQKTASQLSGCIHWQLAVWRDDMLQDSSLSATSWSTTDCWNSTSVPPSPVCFFFPDCFRRGLQRCPCSHCCRQQSGNSSLSVVVPLIKEWIRYFEEFGGTVRTAEFGSFIITFIYGQLPSSVEESLNLRSVDIQRKWWFCK